MIALALLLVAGCKATTDEPSTDDATVPPSIVVTGSVNPHNPLAWAVVVTTDQDLQVAVEYGEQEEWPHRTPPVDLVADEPPRIQVLGLRADTAYQMRAVDLASGHASLTLAARTEPPTLDWPVCTTTGIAGDPDEVFCTQYRLENLVHGGFFCADRSGEPVWFLDHPDQIRLQALQRLEDGHYVAVGDLTSQIVFFDEWGELVADYGPLWFDGRTRFLHEWIDSHEVIELTEGPWAGAVAFLTSTEDELSTGEKVLGEGIVVYDFHDDEVLWDWQSHGALGDDVPIDPALHHGYVDEYWMHGNALVHDVEDDGRESFWLCARDMDWIFKVDVETDAVEWRLGRGGDFTLVDDLDAPDPLLLDDSAWFTFQHAPALLDRDGDRVRLLVFDNRTTDGHWSRVVGYEIDESSHLASIFYEYGDPNPGMPEHFYASIGGDVDLMPGGKSLLIADAYDDPALLEVGFPEGGERWRMTCSTEKEMYRAWYQPSIYE